VSDIQGQGGILRATIHVTRAATGKVETYEIVGSENPELLARLVAEGTKHHGASGALVGPGSAVNAG
jgi:hypothetical protein